MKRSILMCSAFALASTFAGEAAAQAASQGSTIEEVVVTARRVEESAQSVPLSISVASGEQLRQQNVSDIRNLQNFTPSVLIRGGTSDPNAATIVMRGIGAADTLLTTDTSVGVYMDGVYLPRTVGLKGLLQNTDEIARVETLRGPQGTLFGRNTTAGALNVTTVTPGPDFSAYATAAYGNFQQLDVTGGVNVPLGENAAFRIGVLHSNNDGYGQNSAGLRLGKRNLENYHVRLAVNPNDQFSMDISGDYQRSEGSSFFTLSELCGQPGINCGALTNTAPAGQTANPSYIGAGATRYIAEVIRGLPAACRTNGAGFGGCPANAASVIAAANAEMAGYVSKDPFFSYGNDQRKGASELARLGLTLAYDISDSLQIKSITGYIKSDRGTYQDLDGTPYQILTSNNEQTDWSLSQEIQAIGSIGEAIDYVVGVYGSMEQGQEFGIQYASANPPANPPVTMTVADAKNTNQSAFGQFNYHFTDRLTFTGGLRYTRESRGIVSRNHQGGPVADIAIPVLTANLTTGATTVPAPFTACTLPAAYLDILPNPLTGGGTQGVCQIKRENTFSNLSWLGSVDYELSEGTLVFAKAAKGFRSGGQQLRGTNVQASFNPFNPETVISYEVGVKSTFMDRRARINAGLWNTDYNGIQRSRIIVTPSGNATIIQNAAKARLYGAEVEGTLVPVDNLQLNATLAYVKGKYLEYTDGNIDRTNQPFTGTTGVPKWTYSVGARYVVPMEVGDLSFQANWRWQDKMVSFIQPLTPSTTLPCCNVIADPSLSQYAHAYGELNGRITLSFDDLDTKISVFGSNLTNKQILLPAQDLNGNGYRETIPQLPRTYGIQISKRFGG